MQAVQSGPARSGSSPAGASDTSAPRRCSRIIDRLAEEAGIQEAMRRQKLSRRKVTPPILRHSHVVNALMAGVTGAHDSDSRVGPKRLSTTEIYATVAPALVKEAYDRHGFGPVSSWI